MPVKNDKFVTNKNTDIVGVSGMCRPKLAPIIFNNSNSNQVAEELTGNTITNNKITINPSLLDDQLTIVNETATPSDIMSNNRELCGWFNFNPKCMQRFLSPKWALFCLCFGGAFQGLIVNGFINVVITTIERRFGLRSAQTGMIASGYDIASFICLVPVSYFGGRTGASKMKWIAWGIVIMGIGSFVFAMPHYLASTYQISGSDSNLCKNHSNNSTLEENSTDSSIDEITEDLSWNVWLFFLAQLLHGTGAGIYYTMALIGPAAGYIIGGQLLLFYTDFMQETPTNITPMSKNWIGAWYLGFVVMSFMCFLLAIPILAFPKSLPGSEKLEKQSEAHNENFSGQKQTFTKIKEIPKALCLLLKNPTFFFLNLAGASEGLIISGFAVFLPKQIENQFSVSASQASLLMGLISIIPGGGGTFLGGYLVKKLKLSCSGIIRFCLFATAFAAMFTICFFLSCPNLPFAGVTTDYSTSKSFNDISEFNRSNYERYFSTRPYILENQCNKKCACRRRDHEPICGADGILYYSPCFAGCTVEKKSDKIKIFQDCDCIVNDPLINSYNTSNENLPFHNYDAVNITCESQCNYLWIFAILCFFVMFFTFLATMPALTSTLRCVENEQRSFALGIQWIKVRLLGTIPAPIIFGKLIDESCILWAENGSCLVYNNYNMSKYMLTLALVGKFCSFLFFFAAWFYYIPPKSSPQKTLEKNIHEKIPSQDIQMINITGSHEQEKY